MLPSHIAANGVEQQSVIPPAQQLYSPHALGSCSACCLGYFCRLHFTLGLLLLLHANPHGTDLYEKQQNGDLWCIYAMLSHQ